MAKITLNKVLQQIAQDENFKSPKITISDSPYHGFLATVHRITLIDTATSKKLCLFSKEKTDHIQDGFDHFYKNEAEFYNKVIPEFQSITKNDLTMPLIPKCYFANEDFIILEDLLESEYKVWNPLHQPLDSAHVKVVLESYGKFHAFSFALKHKNPEKFESFGDRFEWFLENHAKLMDNGFYKSLTEKLANCFDEETEFHYIEAFANFCSFGQLEFLQKLHNSRENDVYNHGDSWTHNYMFHCNESNQPKEACILDFQLFRRTTPVVDLSSFLAICACTEEVFSAIWDYLKVYHQSLEEHLAALDCPTSIYTWTALKNDWQKFALKGLMIAAIVGKMMIADKDELALRDSIELPMRWDFISRNEHLYTKRMRIVIKYFYNNGILTC